MAATRNERRPAGKRRRGAVCGRASTGARGPRLIQGDCIEVLSGLEEGSVDAVVCDPPYAIGWQNESWDAGAIREAAARHGHGRLSKPEAFEVWCSLWGAGCLRAMKPGAFLLAFGSPRTYHRLAAGLEDAGLEIRDTLMWLYSSGMAKSRRYPDGRRTALKPVLEPIVLARRPLDGTTEETIAVHGTGALEAEACRVEGRLPGNGLISHDPGCAEGSCAPGCAVGLLDVAAEGGEGGTVPQLAPSRFLYCPKPTRAERDAGCEDLPETFLNLLPNASRGGMVTNPHPTLKPIDLMRWLVRLACPGGGLVLDPFMGSGTTGVAATLEDRRFCGIEIDKNYLGIAAARIRHWGGLGANGSPCAASSSARPPRTRSRRAPAGQPRR
ncbi:MAG: site-specific DNA-methyltransferase [Actinobacteria bacterium]|nr:site-specific DNA-methyltransferase [Actinomycetota bacterium]